MNITSKSRYAIKIMMDLALHRDLPHVHRRDIAKRQGVPADYLDQIMQRLRRGGLVDSVRGRGGGYRLSRAPEAITVWDLFETVEDSLYPVECLDDSDACDFEVSCAAKPAWDVILGSVRRSLASLTIAELVAREPALHKMCPVGGVRECKPSRAHEKVIGAT